MTAQSPAGVKEMEEKIKPKFKIFSDEKHVLLNYLKDQGLVSIVITADHAKPAVNELFKKYPFGVAQPGVLITKGDGTKLYSWAIIPTEMNYQGAKDRPLPADIWDQVKSQL